MSTDFKVAYGKEDLIKIRVTPETVGAMLSSMSNKDLIKCLQGYDSSKFFRTDKMLKEHKKIFKEFLKKV